MTQIGTRHALPDAVALVDEDGVPTWPGEVSLATAIAGEDITNDVQIVTEKCNMTVVDLATDTATIISATPALLLGVYVNIAVGTATGILLDGAVAKVTLPIGLAAGTKIDCHGAIFATSLIADSENTATGNITVFWLPNEA
jgi:hypothetical protein